MFFFIFFVFFLHSISKYYEIRVCIIDVVLFLFQCDSEDDEGDDDKVRIHFKLIIILRSDISIKLASMSNGSLVGFLDGIILQEKRFFDTYAIIILNNVRRGIRFHATV